MQKTKISKKKFAGGCCGIIAAIFFIALIASIFNGHGRAQQNSATPTATTAPVLAVSSPTHVVDLKPTVKVTTAPKVTAQPTHQTTPKPTPKPTQPPACQAVNNNPWCYNFNSGNLITSPPSSFCSYFSCVSTFWVDTNGYVAECGNGAYTHSGGVRGACSRDGGVLRPLYSH